MAVTTLRVGLIGAGFIGRTHVFGYALANRAFADVARLQLAAIAEISAEKAAAAGREFGIPRTTDHWRELVEDPGIDVVDISVPTSLHMEIALASVRAGKHVYCEKPLTPTAKGALEVTVAAESAGLKTQVGFNYLANPILEVARDLVAAGNLGDIYSYSGIHAEDYMSDPNGPLTFRHDPRGGGRLQTSAVMRLRRLNSCLARSRKSWVTAQPWSGIAWTRMANATVSRSTTYRGRSCGSRRALGYSPK